MPLVLAATLLVGCRAEPDDRVVIDFWGVGVEGERVQQLVPEFERLHPGIKVRVQQIPWTAAHEKLLTAYVGEATPDVCQLGNTWVPEFVALDALTELEPFIERSDVVDPNDYFEGIWNTNVIEGDVYGVPWYVDTRLMFYRKDLLEQAGYDEPPQTWQEWLQAMRRIKEQAGPEGYAILMPTNEWQHPITLGLMTQPELLRDGGRYGNFQGEGFRRAFEFYVNVFREGLAPALATTQISNVYEEFAKGYVAMYLTGPWNIGEFRRRLPDSLQGAWMTAPMPGPDADTPGGGVAGGASLVLFKASEHKEAAWQWIEYLSRPDVQARFYAITGDLPPRETAWQDSLLANNAYAQAFREQLRHAAPTPKVPEWERIATKVFQYAEAAIRGQMTVDEALAALDRDVDLILEKRRWLLAKNE